MEKKSSLYLSHLQLTQFRNYTELQLAFSAGINCLVGPNGAGKTNVLDALYYLAFTKGFRNTQDRQALQKGAPFFFNGGTLLEGKKKTLIHCNFVKGQGKKILINKKPLKKMSDHIGKLPLVAILPWDTELINGPSASRRRFLDMLISQYDPAFLSHLIHYERLLAQRNAQLKLFQEHRRFDVEELSLWDEQLTVPGMAIQAGRQQFLEDFQPVFNRFFKEIVAEEDETPKLTYQTQLEDHSKEAWDRLWEERREKDRVNLYTTGGIHRDDLVFHINEQSVRNFGSQGQQKTFVIALKLAQYQLLHEQTGRWPLLLLDDIFDKLDETRLRQIARLLDEEIRGQIFITDTSKARLEHAFGAFGQRELRFFQVKDGQISSPEALPEPGQPQKKDPKRKKPSGS
ncbi:MAG: DNA replication/repair protein RecF [Bacteroidota bacterium]